MTANWDTFQLDKQTEPFEFFTSKERLGHAFLHGRDIKYYITNIVQLRLYGDKHLISYLGAIAGHQYYLDNMKSVEAEIGQKITAESTLRYYIRPRVETLVERKRERSQRQYERLLKVFYHPPVVEFDKQERLFIENPFPIMIGSRNSPCLDIEQLQGREYAIDTAKFGEEIDTLFLRTENIPEIKSWLKSRNLLGKVSVHDQELLLRLQDLPFPIFHAIDDVAAAS